MRISHRHKFIFFANPKTGSESVRDYLDPLSDIRGTTFPQTTPEFPFYSHMRPVEALPAFTERGWAYHDYYRFTLVRNPWRRLVSLYAMIKRMEPGFGLSFAEWLEATSPSGAGGGGLDGQRWRKYGTYSLRSFIGGDMGLVDGVFRMEDMDALPASLAAKGLPVSPASPIKRLNAGKLERPHHEFYSDRLVRLVATRYAEDIEMFGYSFEAPRA